MFWNYSLPFWAAVYAEEKKGMKASQEIRIEITKRKEFYLDNLSRSSLR